MTRLDRLIARAGGLPEFARRCPSCGGKVAMSDRIDDMQIPRSERYMIECQSDSCAGVIGDSVRWCVLTWVEECRRQKV